MRHLALLFIGLCLAATSLRAVAHFEDSIPCAQLIRKLHERGGFKSISSQYEPNTGTYYPTISYGEVLPGRHGGKLQQLHLKKTAKTWYSNFNTVRYDLQGDPRWLIDTLGAKGAEFFGFKILNGHNMLIPDREEFLGALEKINHELQRLGKRPLALHFYRAKNNENVNVAFYLQRFIQEHALPIAESGNHLIHDLSFHSGAIFIPEVVLNYSSQVFKFREGFFNFLLSKTEDRSKRDMVELLRYLVNFHDTSLIDSGSAYFHTGIVDLARTDAEKKSNDFINTGLYYLLEVRSDDDRVSTHFNKLKKLFELLYLHSKGGPLFDKAGLNLKKKQQIDEHLADELPLSVLIKALDDYLIFYLKQHSNEFDPSKSQDQLYSKYGSETQFKELICQQVTQSRLDVLDIIERLSNDLPTIKKPKRLEFIPLVRDLLSFPSLAAWGDQNDAMSVQTASYFSKYYSSSSSIISLRNKRLPEIEQLARDESTIPLTRDVYNEVAEAASSAPRGIIGNPKQLRSLLSDQGVSPDLLDIVTAEVDMVIQSKKVSWTKKQMLAFYFLPLNDWLSHPLAQKHLDKMSAIKKVQFIDRYQEAKIRYTRALNSLYLANLNPLYAHLPDWLNASAIASDLKNRFVTRTPEEMAKLSEYEDDSQFENLTAKAVFIESLRFVAESRIQSIIRISK